MQEVNNPRKPQPNRSNKRPAISKSMKQFDQKRVKVDKTAQSSITAACKSYAEPGCSKNYQSIQMQDDEQSTENNAQGCSRGVNQADQTNSTSKSHHFRITVAASITESKILTTTKQKTQIADVRSVADVRATAFNNHEQCIKAISNNEASTSNHLRNSRLMSAQLYSQMDGARRLIPIHPTVERQIRPMNIGRRMDIAALSSSNSMTQKGSLSSCSVEEQPSVTHNQSQDIQVQEMQARCNPIRSQEFQHVPTINIGRSHDVLDRQRNLATQVQYQQQTTRLQGKAHRPGESSNNNQGTFSGEHQTNRMTTPQKQQAQRPKNNISISITPKSNSQHSTLPGVSKKTPPHILSTSATHNNYLLNEQKLPASLRVKSNGNNSKGLATGPENKAASATRETSNSEIPSCSFYQSPRTQLTSASDNVYQNPRTQKQLVDQSTETNSRIRSSPKVTDSTCQTDERMIKNDLYHGVTYDSDDFTHHEEISNQEMTTDETSAETINDYDVYSTGSSSEARPTSAQNSTPTNHQTDSRVVMEQHMLDHFATLFTQMGATLRYTCDMFNNLRSSILETAETYRKLLDAVERFNTLSQQRK